MKEQWEYEYLPFINNQTGEDIPNFRINQVDEIDYIVQTNEALSVEVQERHARLIAAAPDMLEALKYQQFADYDPQASHRKGYYEEAARLREAAIAKAEGRGG